MMDVSMLVLFIPAACCPFNSEPNHLFSFYSSFLKSKEAIINIYSLQTKLCKYSPL